MSKTYEVQGPDGFTYEVTMPDNADEGAIVERVQAFAKAEAQQAGPTDSEAPAAPTGPGTFLENASATAGQIMDGFIPGSRKFLAGAGGVVGNGIAAAIGRDDFDPTEAYATGAASSDINHARLEAEHPQVATAATLAGLAGSFALPAARLARGGSLGAGMLNGAATGAGYGALSGLLNDTGGGRLENAAMGAGFGGALGAAAAPIAQRVAGTVATARRNVPGVNVALTGLENIPRRLSGRQPVPSTAMAHAQADRLLAEDMAQDTISTGWGAGTVPATPDNVAAEVARRQALGVPAIPGDVSDVLTRRTGTALAGQGPVATRARDMIQARQAQQGSRVRQHVIDEMGPAVDPIREAEAITARARTAAGPAYREAYAQGSPMVITPELADLMDRPAFQDSLPQAYKNIQNRGGDPEALGFSWDPETGHVGMTQAPTFEAFDQVVRTLNGSLKRNPLTGRPELDNVTAGTSAVSQELDGYLRRTNSHFDRAKADYADDMAIRDSLERGQAIGKLTGHEINAQARTMPEHAQEAWMAGARTALADGASAASLNPTANVAQSTRQALGLSGAGGGAMGDPVKLQAIEGLSGRPGVMNRLDDRLEAEQQAYRTFAAAAPPPRAQSTEEDLKNLAGAFVGAGRKLIGGNPIGALATAALRGNPRGTLGFRQGVEDRTAELLTASSPGALSEAMGAIKNRGLFDAAAAASRNGRAARIARSGALFTAAQSTDPIDLSDDPYAAYP